MRITRPLSGLSVVLVSAGLLLAATACTASTGATAPSAETPKAVAQVDPDNHDQAGPGDEEREPTVRHAGAATGSCGVERWAVKTGTDADAGSINLSSTSTTSIGALTALPKPGTLPANNRIKPTETTEFQLSATLVEYKLESDSDFHLVLKDTSGTTMIAEIPDPTCVGSTSPLLPGIRNARTEFTAKYTPTSSFQTANVPVTIKGIGFFDFLHGQTGVAGNGIELHSVLDVQFT